MKKLQAFLVKLSLVMSSSQADKRELGRLQTLLLLLIALSAMSNAFAAGAMTTITQVGCTLGIGFIGLIILVFAVISVAKLWSAARRGGEGEGIKSSAIFIIALLFFPLINELTGNRLTTGLATVCPNLTLLN